jgi:hypothetical protein
VWHIGVDRALRVKGALLCDILGWSCTKRVKGALLCGM